MNFMQMTSECPKVYLVWEMGDSDNEVTSRNLTVVTAIRARSSQVIPFLDKTRVAWWKNGFPHYFTRIPNAANWSSIHLRLIDEELDLAQWDVNSFNRRLDMYNGISYRDVKVTSPRGNCLHLHAEHLVNMAYTDLCLGHGTVRLPGCFSPHLT